MISRLQHYSCPAEPLAAVIYTKNVLHKKFICYKRSQKKMQSYRDIFPTGRQQEGALLPPSLPPPPQLSFVVSSVPSHKISHK